MKDFIGASLMLTLCFFLMVAMGWLHALASFEKLLDVDYKTLSKEKKDCELGVIRANSCVAVIYFEERVSDK
jgi:hypothetical protein